MSDMKDGGPAFPRTKVETVPMFGQVVKGMSEDGMSLRDWFAGQALAGGRASD